jgi:tRNA (cmo5U34)-methyltransferase
MTNTPDLSSPEIKRPSKDTVYAEHQVEVAPFEFNGEVAEVFDDMILRSVPGYALSIELIRLIAQRYGQNSTQLYDLGCSSGVATRALAEATSAHCAIIGIDNSPAMIARCQQSIGSDAAHHKIELRCEDLLNSELSNASVIVLNYTLQFLPMAERDRLMAKIYSALIPGGVVFLAEKVIETDPKLESELTELHLAFKRRQGYSDLEIAQKRAALEAVLVPETEQQHLARLRSAGFEQSATLQRAINFLVMVGWKRAA